MSHLSYIFKNGIVLSAADTPVGTFLEAHPGAYTTTRTINDGTALLFWERHVRRLSNSFKLLLKENPKLLFEKPESLTSPIWELCRGVAWDSVIRYLVNDCMRKTMGHVAKERKFEELAITTLVGGRSENEGGYDEGRISEAFDVYMHVGRYVPPVFGAEGNAARLAVVGRCREFASAKYSDWVRARKRLEKLRPPSVTELLLSNDGDQILEGCVSNIFVVCFKEKRDDYTAEQSELRSLPSLEVQTAPVCDGVLPGIIRQVIIDVCLRIGIPFREVAPSWSKRELWAEAFITTSLRIIQPVDAIQVPNSWKLIDTNTWEEISWVEKQFEDGPGKITSILQREVMRAAGAEAFPITSLEDEDGRLIN